MKSLREFSPEQILDACFDNGLDIWAAAQVVNDLWGEKVIEIGEAIKGRQNGAR